MAACRSASLSRLYRRVVSRRLWPASLSALFVAERSTAPPSTWASATDRSRSTPSPAPFSIPGSPPGAGCPVPTGLHCSCHLAAAHGQLPLAGGDRQVIDVERDELGDPQR